MDSHDFAKWGRIGGVALFVVAFLLPGVREGANYYPGWECAVETLFGTRSLVAMLSHHERFDDWTLYFVAAGWISPLVLFGLVAWSARIKRWVAAVLPPLLVVPWMVFAWPEGGVQIRPCIGHYIWTAGCLLIFTPEYKWFLALVKKAKNAETDRN